MNTIGKEIRKRRIDLQITQQTLADIAGVGINTLVAIERGTGNPSFKTIQAILDALGLELTCHTKSL